MYIYKLPNGKELCRSSAKIEFTALFPQFKELKPVEEKKAAGKKKEADNG